ESVTHADAAARSSGLPLTGLTPAATPTATPAVSPTTAQPTPPVGFPTPASLVPTVIRFFYDDDADNSLTCNGTELANQHPTICQFDSSRQLTITRKKWGGDAVLSRGASKISITGPCNGSLLPSPTTPGDYNLTPDCAAPASTPTPAPTRQPATGKNLVDEWFTDLPWNQKLSTVDSNLINAPFVMPWEIGRAHV